jgi:hypothetical protein
VDCRGKVIQAIPGRRVTMDKLKEVSPQLAELIEEILSDDEGLKGFLPNQPVQTGEKVLGKVPTLAHRLWYLSEFYNREATQARVDARFAPPGEAKECNARGLKAQLKMGVINGMFWWIVRTELNLWDTPLFLREGWVIVEGQRPVGPWGPPPL